MLHSTLSALLVSVASRYAQLSPSDVGIGIGGGRLVIDNVQLRADTFNGPKIPFRVHEGRAGRLRINVPWSALSSTPVKVYLENVHLVAGPKQAQQSENPKPIHKKKPSTDVSSAQGEWHQTMVGRLLFNVSVEVYGLKVEYRDDECVGIISIASLRANSAGPDWNQRFVSLLSDLDPEQPEASAVSMRKLVHLSGVHWVMIPRAKGAPPAEEGLVVNEQGRSPRFSERHLDLNSYESKSPILDGIAVTVRVLMCTGMALVGDSISPGLHAEVDIDLEETSMSLTARQIKRIDQIIQEGFGVAKKRDPNQNAKHDVSSTKPRPWSPSTSQGELQAEELYADGGSLTNEHMQADGSLSQNAESEPPYENGGSIDDYLYEPHLPAQSRGALETNVELRVDGEQREASKLEHADREEDNEVLSETEDEVLLEEEDSLSADGEGAVGGFSSFWQAIVGEYADETVDDAAVALGLANRYTSADEEEQHSGEQSEDDTDIQYARAAVNAAAVAGGRTFRLRLKTPDLAARDEVEKLREELEKEKERRQELEDVESVLYNAEDRVKDSENEIRELRQRNAALAKELEDLESMASRAGRNKDAMIRQMEAALVKAEKNLQTLYQTKHEQQKGQVKESRNDLEIEDSSPKSIGRDSTKQPLKSVGEGTIVKAGTDCTDAIDQVPVAMPAADDMNDMNDMNDMDDMEDDLSSEDDMNERAAAPAQTSPTTQSESASVTLEEVSIVDVSHSEQDEESNNDLLTAEPVADAPSAVEPQFGNSHTGIMNSKHIERAISSEGLTLV